MRGASAQRTPRTAKRLRVNRSRSRSCHGEPGVEVAPFSLPPGPCCDDSRSDMIVSLLVIMSSTRRSLSDLSGLDTQRHLDRDRPSAAAPRRRSPIRARLLWAHPSGRPANPYLFPICLNHRAGIGRPDRARALSGFGPTGQVGLLGVKSYAFARHTNRRAAIRCLEALSKRALEFRS